MFYVYALRSNVNGDIYIGRCDDLKIRYKLHNLGKVKSTKAYKPWTLVYYEAYRNKNDATRREKKLKMHAVKSELISRLADSLSASGVSGRARSRSA